MLDVGIDLDVVALRGSVAPQMATEIKQAVGPMLRVSVGDRPTLRDIYDELRKEKARQAEGDTNRG